MASVAVAAVATGAVVAAGTAVAAGAVVAGGAALPAGPDAGATQAESNITSKTATATDSFMGESAGNLRFTRCLQTILHPGFKIFAN